MPLPARQNVSAETLPGGRDSSESVCRARKQPLISTAVGAVFALVDAPATGGLIAYEAMAPGAIARLASTAEGTPGAAFSAGATGAGAFVLEGGSLVSGGAVTAAAGPAAAAGAAYFAVSRGFKWACGS